MTNILATAARSLIAAYGGDVPDWLRADVAAVEAALTAPAPRAVIIMEGGCIQSVLSDQPLNYTTVDYDVEGVDPVTDAFYAIPQDDAEPAEALRYEHPAELVAPERIAAIRNAPLAFGDWHGYTTADVLARWRGAYIDDAVRDDDCWLVTASFAFQGDEETGSMLVPASTSAEALQTMRQALDSFYDDGMTGYTATAYPPRFKDDQVSADVVPPVGAMAGAFGEEAEGVHSVRDAVALVRDAVVLLDNVLDTDTPDALPDTLTIALATGATMTVRVTLTKPDDAGADQ